MTEPPALGWRWFVPVVTAAGLACLACAAPRMRVRAGPLVPTSEIRSDFLWRQRLLVQADRFARVFDAVVQKHCDELVVVLLDPLGVRLVTIRQQGLRVSTEDVSPGMRLPPEAILADIHRAFLWPSRPPASGASTSRRSKQGWVVHERWDGATLRERSWHPSDAAEPETVVTYLEATGDGLPVDVRLENPRFGYVLRVRTVSRTPLRCPAGSR